MCSYGNYVAMIKALADEARLKIVCMLSDGEMCACVILEEFDFTQPTLSYHMRILTDSSLVTGIRDGALMRYHLNHEQIDKLKDFITDLASR